MSGLHEESDRDQRARLRCSVTDAAAATAPRRKQMPLAMKMTILTVRLLCDVVGRDSAAVEVREPLSISAAERARNEYVPRQGLALSMSWRESRAANHS